ncbi:BatA domain-containing protein [uncultured Marixanthomonas sp.]|uniref:BatA domain-containing protein n=1 Tax=uncultured Marixanthomonas sp. TaxID=757245 RepID=UPI0030DAD6A3|tara:strand:+ start:35453 stop:37375 length:1923 start_codon:yes stop_codon:yes gene_type:complete
MQFQHPELLYALFLLLIPIFIHLFQLRRFKQVDFTNVAFLKKVTIQTRKSSQLKKWITLLLRLLALASIIIAFAQPFTATKTALNTNKETVLYIDNSFSMQAKGTNGPLLNRSLQELYNLQIPSEKISWFTNNSTHKNVSLQDFTSEILSVSYAQGQLSLSEVLLKANQLFSDSEASNKRLILISDFQQNETFPEVPENITINTVRLQPVNTNNITVDSVYISSKNGQNIQLKVDVSASGEVPESVPVSLFNGESLVAKTAVDFSSNNSNTTVFDIENTSDFKGRLEITDPNLPYDNNLFFSINAPKKIKVLSINEADSGFLQRLFNQEEFEYTQQTQNSLNYNNIPNQDFIIINQLTAIPASLVTAIQSFSANGGSVLVIPSEQAEINDYNNLLATLGMGSFSGKISSEKQITQIVFDHPLYQNVFEKRVVNFQYPTVNSYYQANTNATSVLNYEDGKPFIFQKSNTYFLSAPINLENSNFQNSPLIVPTFYNMAQQSLALPNLYYTIGKQNNFDIPVQLMEDEILKIKDSSNVFIPLQQTKANKVAVTTIEEPATSGTFDIVKETDFITNISYNFNRNESNLQYLNTENWNGVNNNASISELFDSITEANNINSFWKWFVIFAVLFLLIEMLVLKFFK